MKEKVHVFVRVLLIFVLMIFLMASMGCFFYPKAERAPGELVSDVNFEIIDETTVVGKHDNGGRQWIYVDCDYWAGCFMRCDGASSQCKQLAKDSKFSILSIFMNVFN